MVVFLKETDDIYVSDSWVKNEFGCGKETRQIHLIFNGTQDVVTF